MRTLATVACCWSAAVAVLPGPLPHDYYPKDEVEMKVNKLTSARTQLPMDYYSLPYCKSKYGVVRTFQNLGEILAGDSIESSPYRIQALVDATCVWLCSIDLTRQDMSHLRDMIQNEYMVNWMIDGLPALTPMRSLGSPETVVGFDGFPVGFAHHGNFYLHNHVVFNISFHESEEYPGGIRVVGFEVTPYSLNTNPMDELKQRSTQPACDAAAGKGYFSVGEDKAKTILYTYDIQWSYSSTRWVSRWDAFRKMRAASNQIHWFSICNSLLIILMLSAGVASVLLRALKRDIAEKNDTSSEGAVQTMGWQLVHGDVFRKPPHFTLLAVSVGSGAQLLGMLFVTLILANVGLLSLPHRGSVLQSMLLLFTVMGVVAGYVAGRMCKLFEESAAKKVSLLAALLYPGLYLTVFLVLNLLMWRQQSVGAVPLPTILAMLAMWLGISFPLVLLGFRAAFRADPIELPVKTATTPPREIPRQCLCCHPAIKCLAAGLLCFSAIFTELFFIMNSVWQRHFYDLFGYLAAVLLILIISCVEVSILVTYCQLTAGDYRWWWQSFLASAATSLYMMIYSVIYFKSRLMIDSIIPTIIYFAYMALASVMLGLLTGSIGAIASFAFVRGIYSTVEFHSSDHAEEAPAAYYEFTKEVPC